MSYRLSCPKRRYRYPNETRLPWQEYDAYAMLAAARAALKRIRHPTLELRVELAIHGVEDRANICELVCYAFFCGRRVKDCKDLHKQ